MQLVTDETAAFKIAGRWSQTRRRHSRYMRLVADQAAALTIHPVGRRPDGGVHYRPLVTDQTAAVTMHAVGN